MKLLITISLLLFSVKAFTQNWSYVSGSCCVSGNSVSTQSIGSAKLIFKSDGTPISVGFGSNPSVVIPKIFNGTSWVALGTFTTTGTVGAIDLEIYNDEPYIAFLNSGLKVRKYDGANWVDVGTALPGYSSSLNFDFAIDNTGTPYVACFDRKIFKFNGTAWSVTYTLPAGGFPNSYGYYFTQDNTLAFDQNNNLVYNVSSNNLLTGEYKQFVKSYNGSTESIIGDTIIYNTGYTSYSPKIYTNSSKELFAIYHKAISNNFVVKKFDGSAWINFGDTLGFRKNLTTPSLAFTSDNSFILSSTAQVRTIYQCQGSTSTFQPIDTINHAGLVQITDLDINPTTNELFVTFNNLNGTFGDYTVMKHVVLTTGIEKQTIESNRVMIYPNPSKDNITIQGSDLSNNSVVKITSLEGKTIMEWSTTNSSIDISALNAGIYFINVTDKNGETLYGKFIKE